jgi:type I restriction enzyme S subunit
MNEQMTKLTIGELLDTGAILDIKDGNHGEKHPKGADFISEGVPFIVAQDIKNNFVDLSGCSFISYEQAQGLKKGRAITGDVLLTHKGTVGNSAIVPDFDGFIMLSPQVTYYRVNPKKICNRYLKYAFSEPHFQAQMKSYSAQSTRPYISITSQRGLEIFLFPWPIQQKIAAILSAYDDLIENNLRRIKILEEMAQTLYREWFVKFRFPGHQKVKTVNSLLGKIPEGWEVTKLRDVVECKRDTVDPGDHLSDRHYVPIDCLPRKSFTLLEDNPWQEAQSSLQTFECDDILFGAMRPYFHKVVITPFKGVTRSTCFVLRPHRPDDLSYALMTVFQEESVKFADAHSRGTTIPYAVWEGSMAEMPVILPPVSQRQYFNLIVRPMIQFIQSAFFRQRNLRQTRDLLLPKLISGELDISELDITIPEANA